MQYDTATVIAAFNAALSAHAPGKRVDCPNEVEYDRHHCCKGDDWTCPFYPGTEQEEPSVFRPHVQPDPRNHPARVLEHIQDNSFGACYCSAAKAGLHSVPSLAACWWQRGSSGQSHKEQS